MIIHAFAKAGFIEEDENNVWQTPSEFCFGKTGECVKCEQQNLLMCAWCTQFLCVNHALVETHVCNNFVE